MSTLWVEPSSGLSGDMWLGALVGLADAGEGLIQLPSQLGLSNVSLEIIQVKRADIPCSKVNVMDTSPTHYRHLSDILAILERSRFTHSVKTFSRNVFESLAAAEAQVHNISMERVHFHEVGAVDTLVDVIGAALLLDRLKIDTVISTPVCTGFGTTRCQHGEISIPAPATRLLLDDMPTYPGIVAFELVTPTGAAILKELAPSFSKRPQTALKTHCGAGTQEFDSPNCLRLSLCG